MAEIFTAEELEAVDQKTPFFIFSKAEVLRRYDEFKKYFPDGEIYYAMKANSEPEILRILCDAGSSFEVASIYELDLLRDLDVDKDTVIYGSAIKPLEGIRAFYEYGARKFAFDSMQELEKIASGAPGSKVFVRVKVNDTGSVFRFSGKFGTEIENAVPLLERAKALGLETYGISFHVGSQASNPMAWANALEKLGPVLVELKRLGIEIEVINLGGGYPTSYASSEVDVTLEEISKNIMKAYKSLPYQPKLIFEPGRAIVASAGCLVTEVIAKVSRESGDWLFLDAGVYSALYEAMAYQGSTRYKVTSMRRSYDSGEKIFSLAGPTGDSEDIITREALLPSDIDSGDKLIIHSVGAYSLVVSSPFNGFPKPEVVFV